jgi:fructosamine-3-kinase
MHSVHLPFQCSKVYRLHDQKKNHDNSFNFRFQIGNDRQSKRLLANWGEFFFFIIFFLDKNRNKGFSSRHLLRLQKDRNFLDPMISF